MTFYNTVKGVLILQSSKSWKGHYYYFITVKDFSFYIYESYNLDKVVIKGFCQYLKI
jgi:hypothetical protein